MITRASVRIDWSTDEVEWERRLAMTDAEIAAEDAEFEREMATWQREHEANMARLTTLQRYRYERRHLLVSLLRARSRIDMYRREAMFDFMVPREVAFFKKRQTELLAWRLFLRTGVVPSEATQ